MCSLVDIQDIIIIHREFRLLLVYFECFFFFQAEDGIRDLTVTGVQTCALPILEGVSWRATRIRGFNNQTIVLPNSVIARERLEVYPRNNLNARVLPVSIDYHVPQIGRASCRERV